ncbi:MAG TPA: hypothetical protein ENK44_07220 [Caldithrix abyssi]|uniref:Rubrerythrin diiron-binding domain-containing protein n=1 Tax=Caldithrix abyssi TaxID=187145 RepID=A0A7V4WVK2_CALAY|nr:hypothetical protein [Caldithrix abyssi]
MKTLRDLLDIAIQQEIDSQKLYRYGMEIVSDEKAREFLKQLAEEEVRHENTLINIKETELYDLDVAVEDEAVFQNTLDSHGENVVELDKKLTVEDILEIALKREFAAGNVFAAAAKAARDEELITLFENLAKEEDIHHQRVEKEYRLLTGQMGEEL